MIAIDQKICAKAVEDEAKKRVTKHGVYKGEVQVATDLVCSTFHAVCSELEKVKGQVQVMLSKIYSSEL